MDQQAWKKFMYTSLAYTEDLEGFTSIKEDEKGLVLKGYNAEEECSEYHFAANEAADIIECIASDEQACLITFIPHPWVEAFEKKGFRVRNIWRDYWKESLEDVCEQKEVQFLKENEAKEASEITRSCRGLSRGFLGETPEWISSWLEGSCGGNVKDSTIIVKRNEKKQIIGLVCTGVYGHETPKGAVAWIREIAVHPEYQNQGVATSLLKQALAYCKSHGAKRAYLAADEQNKHAIHLYIKYGFEPAEDDMQIDMIRE
jgi:ribosomal protein S18 acetylase RimI-like enzyme